MDGVSLGLQNYQWHGVKFLFVGCVLYVSRDIINDVDRLNGITIWYLQTFPRNSVSKSSSFGLLLQVVCRNGSPSSPLPLYFSIPLLLYLPFHVLLNSFPPNHPLAFASLYFLSVYLPIFFPFYLPPSSFTSLSLAFPFPFHSFPLSLPLLPHRTALLKSLKSGS